MLFAVALAFVFAACAPPANLLDETQLNDISFLSGEPCAAPCWNNIIPGETSYRDAKILIEDDGRFGNIDEPEPEEGSSIRGFRFSASEAQVCCEIISMDGEVVSRLVLQLAPVMILGEGLEQYGDPDYLLGSQVSEDQAYMALIWTDVPMVVFVFVAGAAEGELSPTSEIISLMYMLESDMQSVIDCASLYVWEGYLSYADYIDEDYDFVGPDVGNEDVCGSAGS